MINFLNDYSYAANPKIAEALLEKCGERLGPYYEGKYTALLNDKIKLLCGDDARCAVMVGGTQANVFVISNRLSPCESVISASSGHINVHEAGAVEHSGHKILCVETDDGKLTVGGIEKLLDTVDSVQAQPKMVYISQPTELGTLYSKSELQTLGAFCHERNLLLFVDGARMGVALTCRDCDFTLKDVYANADVFYIGGTKNGLPLGELLVFHGDAFKILPLLQKQAGVLLAKGDFISMMFCSLLPDLFFELAATANQRAETLCQGLTEKGVRFAYAPQTNQLFPIFTNDVVERLKKDFLFSVWERRGENTVVRFVCDYATKTADIKALISKI